MMADAGSIPAASTNKNNPHHTVVGVFYWPERKDREPRVAWFSRAQKQSDGDPAGVRTKDE